jgi:hypothetical protein
MNLEIPAIGFDNAAEHVEGNVEAIEGGDEKG